MQRIGIEGFAAPSKKACDGKLDLFLDPLLLSFCGVSYVRTQKDSTFLKREEKKSDYDGKVWEVDQRFYDTLSATRADLNSSRNSSLWPKLHLRSRLR